MQGRIRPTARGLGTRKGTVLHRNGSWKPAEVEGTMALPQMSVELLGLGGSVASEQVIGAVLNPRGHAGTGHPQCPVTPQVSPL